MYSGISTVLAICPQARQAIFFWYAHVRGAIPSLAKYCHQLLSVWEHHVITLTAPLQTAAETMALVLAIAGMMFFTTCIVSLYVTPLMPYSSARFKACLYNHDMCSTLSVSMA